MFSFIEQKQNVNSTHSQRSDVDKVHLKSIKSNQMNWDYFENIWNTSSEYRVTENVFNEH